MIYESVMVIGWKEVGPKPSALLVLYAGEDVEAALDVLDKALDEHVVTHARVYRGQGLSGQLVHTAGPSYRPTKPGPVLPATGRLP